MREKIRNVDGKEHEHIGFYIGDDMAVSNSTKRKSSQEALQNLQRKNKDNLFLAVQFC